MSVRVTRGRGDPAVNAVKAALEAYIAEHPGATAEVYRYNSAAIRVRVTDDRFARVSFAKRHDGLWDYISTRVPDEVMSEVSFLIAVTSTERDRELSSVEFDHPSRSRL
jgi:hypothetical protein